MIASGQVQSMKMPHREEQIMNARKKLRKIHIIHRSVHLSAASNIWIRGRTEMRSEALRRGNKRIRAYNHEVDFFSLLFDAAN
jgi:hypothetical protein